MKVELLRILSVCMHNVAVAVLVLLAFQFRKLAISYIELELKQLNCMA